MKKFLVTFLILFSSVSFAQKQFQFPLTTPQSDAILQGFYWNSTPGGIWWDSLAKLAPRIRAAGFSSVWFPAAMKGAAGPFSMGYDPYDQYDFGEYNQKGSIETRFGSRSELERAIQVFHANGLQVFADAVMGHMNGGDAKIPYECQPYPEWPDSGWLLFNYPNGSGRFPKNASHFYPNLQTCDANPPYHGPDPAFRFGEYLAHAQSHVKDSLIVWGQYLRNVLGFDGFRIDEAKSIDPIFVGPWLSNSNAGGFAFAEYFGSTSEIMTWLHYTQNVFGGDVSMFDFPLRYSLADMCNNTYGTYDMNNLDWAGLVNAGVSGYDVVTFVENHDLDRTGWDGNIDIGHHPIIYDKHMAYAYILFSEGRPCVFFRDYFMYGLAGRIDTLLWIRAQFLWGGTTKRSGLNPWYVGSLATQEEQARDLYVARRDGGNGRPQAFLVLNDNPYEWRGVWVNTNHPNAVFRDYTGVAMDKQAAGDGRVDLWAPPRGYAIYVPDTSQSMNHSPYIQTIPDQQAYINTAFEFQVQAADPNNEPITYSLTQSPVWLNISPSGLLSGTPAVNDTGTSTIIVTVTDARNETAADTFSMQVEAIPTMDGVFEGEGVWGVPLAVADTLDGWDTTRVYEIYVTHDPTYYYLGAKVKARQWMNWAFLVNTKPGGGTTESWGRNIVYNHSNRPEYIMRGTFQSYAEFHTWTGSNWSGVGNGLASTEFGENLSSDSPQEGWVEARIPKSSLGNLSVLAIQFYLTGNQSANATFDACPNDQNTTAWSGITTQLRYYTIFGTKTITLCNLQFPPSATISGGGSATIYARGFGVGVTDTAGQAAGVEAWIGYSATNTNPMSWTNWVEATYNVDANNSDEYQVSIGADLPGGTYYYASRFQYNGGTALFGGYSTNGGGIWDGTNNVSGVLIVNAPPAVPTLLSPAYGDTNVATIVDLEWTSSQTATMYHLQVSTNSTFSSFIVNDSTLNETEWRLSSLLTLTKYYWRVRAKNAYGWSAFSAPFSFTTGLYTRNYYHVNARWNMVSLPLHVSDSSKDYVFPEAISSAFTFHNEEGYVETDTLVSGTGYWLKFPADDSVAISGSENLLDTIAVRAGWNMIGCISRNVLVDSIIQIPAGIVLSEFYGYKNGYIPSEILEPARSYWVKVAADGALVLKSDTATKFQKKTTPVYIRGTK